MKSSRWILALVFLGATGCGYTTRPMHSESIRTVHVPIFKTQDFRRNIEFQLTEAVVKELEKRHYKVVDSASADSILEGNITTVRKRVSVQTPHDEPRQLTTSLFIDVQWRDLRTGEILSSGQTAGIPTQSIRQSAEFAPELGQSFSTATQEIVNRVAIQTVDLMEEAW